MEYILDEKKSKLNIFLGGGVGESETDVLVICKGFNFEKGWGLTLNKYFT